MHSSSSADHRIQAARDALVAALPVICLEEIEALWRRGNAITPEILAVLHAGTPTEDDLQAYAVARESVVTSAVEGWCREHNLVAAWLLSRLTVAVKRWDPDSLSRPFLTHAAEKDAPRQAVASISAETALRVAFEADYKRRLLSPWLELEARPLAETEEAFLDRARAHYRARAELLNLHGFQRARRSSPELARHAGWLLRRRVKRLSYGVIAEEAGAETDTVKKAVKRLATLLDL